MAATGRIAVVTSMNPSYSPDSAIGTTWVCPQLHLDSLIRFVQLTHHHRAWINLSYSPVGANVHPQLIHGFLGLYESTPKQHIDRFIRFCRAHGHDQQTDTYRDRQTTQHATSIAICRIKLMLYINFLHIWPADWAKAMKNSKSHQKWKFLGTCTDAAPVTD